MGVLYADKDGDRLRLFVGGEPPPESKAERDLLAERRALERERRRVEKALAQVERELMRVRAGE